MEGQGIFLSGDVKSRRWLPLRILKMYIICILYHQNVEVHILRYVACCFKILGIAIVVSNDFFSTMCYVTFPFNETANKSMEKCFKCCTR